MGAAGMRKAGKLHLSSNALCLVLLCVLVCATYLAGRLPFFSSRLNCSHYSILSSFPGLHEEHLMFERPGLASGVNARSLVSASAASSSQDHLRQSPPLLSVQQSVQLSHQHNLGQAFSVDTANDPPLSQTLLDKKDFVVASGDWDRVLAQLPQGGVISVTFTNNDYRELMTNWVLHNRKLKVPYIVAVFDEAVSQYCQMHGITWVWAHKHLASGNFRKDLTRFRSMGSVKPQLAADLLRRGRFTAVVLSDTDTAWLRDPKGLIDMHPLADIMVSTDCLSHDAEAKGKTNHNRCGHTPGSRYSIALNTGVLVFTNSTPALAVLDRWHKELADQNKNLTVHKNGRATGMRLTDQMEFNILAEEYMIRPLVADPSDPALLLCKAWGDPMRMWVLPVTVAAGGHVYFSQHTPQSLGVVPFVVHTTFQKHGNIAKKARLREEGIWIEDNAAYYERGNFLSFQMDVKGYVEAEAVRWRHLHGVEMQQHHKHMLAARYQLALVQDAFGLAAALKRKLVLPKFICYCDQDYYINVLANCTIDGADTAVPFVCPMDLFMIPDNIQALHTRFHTLDYRTRSFLSKSSPLPAKIRNSQADVVMVPSPLLPPEIRTASQTVQVQFEKGPATSRGLLSGLGDGMAADGGRIGGGSGGLRSARMVRAEARSAAVGQQGRFVLPPSHAHAALLPMHVDDQQALHVLEPLKQVRILNILNLAPGSFGGFAVPLDSMNFDRNWTNGWSGSGWCCTGGSYETQWDYVYWRYALHTRMVERSRDFRDLVFDHLPRPFYCDDPGRLNAENGAHVKAYPNHPCSYLLGPGS